MNQLLSIGFEKVGYWRLDGDELVCELTRMGSKRNILYAFVSDGDVKYIGKTTSPLANRMGGYRSPSPSQTTNVRNHAHLRHVLESGGSVDILALPDDGLLHYGPFHLNLAAGLEDDLIRVIDPEWNGRRGPSTTGVPNGVRAPDLTPKTEVAPAPRDPAESTGAAQFEVVLHPTYYHQGFFNVRVPFEHLFGGDGEDVEIFVQGGEDPITGMINRTANRNGTPRIMGGAALRDWFRAAAEEGQALQVDVRTKNSIRLVVQPVATAD